ncbi:hypothetical protein HK096_002133, partial [Nowakowskiella sp. JEL0078]
MFQPHTKLHDENILQTIKPELLTNRITDIMTAAIIVLRERVQNLTSSIRSHNLQIDVFVGTLTPHTVDFHAKIKSLAPRTMFWGAALVDALDPADFARVARTCSSSATVHYLAVTRWAVDVKGAWTLDYVCSTTEQRIEIVAKALERLNREAREGERKPIVESAILRVDYVLRDLCVRRWIEEVLRVWDVGMGQVAWWVPVW